jgi:hypothetical protein
MLRQGWVSAHMVAERLGVHVVTVHRLVPRLAKRDVRTLGRTRFIRCTALAAVYDPEMAKLFKLLDWSDMVHQADAEDLLDSK